MEWSNVFNGFFLKSDILKVVGELQNKGFVNWRINNMFISLLIKKGGDKIVGDFWAICLLLATYNHGQNVGHTT